VEKLKALERKVKQWGINWEDSRYHRTGASGKANWVFRIFSTKAYPHSILRCMLGVLVPFCCMLVCLPRTYMNNINPTVLPAESYGYLFLYHNTLFIFAVFVRFFAKIECMMFALLLYAYIFEMHFDDEWNSLTELKGFPIFVWTNASTSWQGTLLLANTICLGLLFLLLNLIVFAVGQRFVHIYSSTFVAILSYMLVQSIVRLLGLSEESALQTRLYEVTDIVIAPFMCEQFMELKSVFVKFGQYLGARADIVPEHWAHTLTKLQDDLPSDSPVYVEKTVRESFGYNIDEVFESFDFEPPASASIAQVHRAVLKDKRQVVVKIQHRNIDQIIEYDLRQALHIARFMAYLNPKFDTLVTVFSAWSSEMLKELNFEEEAKNLQLVHSNLCPHV
jgi:hypothetical protein